MARLLARTHLSLWGLEGLVYRDKPYAEKLKTGAAAVRTPDFDQWRDQMGEVVRRIEALNARVQELIDDAHLPYGVVHGDAGEWNVLVHAGEPALLDFDMAHVDLLAYDLAQCLTQWAQTFESRRTWDVRIAALMLDAYSEVRPLTAEERQAVALAMPLRQTIDTLAIFPRTLAADAPMKPDDLFVHFAVLNIADDEGWLAELQ